MISRIYVTSKEADSRGALYQKSWRELGIKGKISKVQLADSYIIDSKLKKNDLDKIAQVLTNPILEKSSINILPMAENFTYAIEIGFKPGVTDNIGHTVKETIIDSLQLNKTEDLSVFTSKVFLVLGQISKKDVETIASSLHNSLIERAEITEYRKFGRAQIKVPKVLIKKGSIALKVSLEVSDEELMKISRKGIVGESGFRRGPLTTDIASMKAIQEYFRKLKRAPTDIELESLAQTWSEHCKHTIFSNPIDEIGEGLYRSFIKGATNEIRKQKGKADFCVSVFSDNAGGIIFDDNFLISHKMETHNTPSVLDPFGGAMTGIGGVNRDAIGFGLGAKPVANLYGFCFGEPTDARPLFRDKDKKQQIFLPKRIMDGVVKGINVYGNCSGIPTISGFVKYDERFRGKPLVFAGTIGLIPRKIKNKPAHEKSARPGDFVVMIGGQVGADGIHGATFSSVVLDANSPATAVQIGDPITQKKLSDALVKEVRDLGLYTSITDNGAGGLSCSVAEMAKECGGAEVDLEKVPLKYAGLEPWEIWISESQERMTLSVPKQNWSKLKEILERRGVEATVIGKFTNNGKMIVKWHGKKIMDLSMEFLHNGLPKQHLYTLPATKSFALPQLPKRFSGTDILHELLSVNNLSGHAFISEQYDHEVQASSVLKPLSGAGRINTDAQVFKPVLSSEKGAVLSFGVYPSYGDISTYHMTACAIDTAVRNAVSAGGSLSHLAILDNFCWCSSYDQTRLFELKESLKACYEYAVGYGTPFISGKDSMFNDFKGYDEKGKPIKVSVPPTILISAIGVMNDLYKTTSPEFKNSGDLIYLLGETHDELGASEYYKLLAKKEGSGAIGNNVPKVDLEKNIKTYRALEEAINQELLSSSLSVTSGGLAVALAKASVGGMLGCEINVLSMPGSSNLAEVKLFSESQGRILVSLSSKNEAKFKKLMAEIPHIKLGRVLPSSKFVVRDDGKDLIKSEVQKLYRDYHKFSEKMK